MYHLRKRTLNLAIVAAIGTMTLSGCASNSADNQFAQGCDAGTINQLEVLKMRLTEAINNDVARWEPAEALVIKNEVESAIANCDAKVAGELIARGEREAQRYEALVADAERIKREQAAENQRYLERAERELAQIEQYKYLSEAQQREKSKGQSALAEGNGELAFMTLSQLHNDLKNSVIRYEVVKGDTLWDIAGSDSVYNDPFKWSVIYRQNETEIDNPDLIYPGQIFSINRDIK